MKERPSCVQYGVAVFNSPKHTGGPTDVYLGIDQHRKPLTVCIRDEQGDLLLRRQVSTKRDLVRAFFEQLRERTRDHGGFVATLEICGFCRRD